MKTTLPVPAVAIATLACLCAGCASAEGTTEEEPIGTVTSAICPDGGPDYYAGSLDSCGAYVSGTSTYSTLAYDHTDCENTWTMKVDTPSPVNVLASWGESLPTSQVTCELAYVKMTVYKYYFGFWTYAGSWDAHGTWNGSSCSLSVSQNLSGNMTSISIGVEAYTDTSPMFYKKGYARAARPPC